MIEAVLIHVPKDNIAKIKLCNELKSRFLSARKIPYSCVRKHKHGYYIKSAKWKHEYFVAKNNGKWNCECHDYAVENYKICKHIIKVILYRNIDAKLDLEALKKGEVKLC
jgi:hypothetical protein